MSQTDSMDEIMATTTRAFHRKLFLRNALEDVLGELSYLQ